MQVNFVLHSVVFFLPHSLCPVVMVEELIFQGANVTKEAKDAFTPLHFASQAGHVECVSMLV